MKPVVARMLHPAAWWLWAVAAAVVASRSRNPLTLLLIGAAAIWVAGRRHRGGRAGDAVAVFVRLGLVVIAMRVALTVLLGVSGPGTVLVRLPSLTLPEWMAGLDLGGPLTLEMLLAALYEGLRLAVLLVLFGAANTLASPYRLVRSMPPVLHEVGVAVTVGVSLAPQLVVSVGQVGAARRLRGRPGGLRGVGPTVLPVLDASLERALHTAASMDVRGHGRRVAVEPALRRRTATVASAGVVATVLATYSLLDGTMPRWVPLAAGVVGVACLGVSLRWTGRRVHRTVYRPDPWAAPEWVVVGLAAAGLATFLLGAGAAELVSVSTPATWPVLGAASVLSAACFAAAGVVSPPVRATGDPGGRP